MSKTIEEIDISKMMPLRGAYDTYLLTKTKLISMIRVEGINMDLLDTHGKERLFAANCAFLLSTVDNKNKITNLSLTMKADMSNFNLYWKRRYLEVEKDNSIPPEAKENQLQLIASKCLNMESIAASSELTTKQHLIVVSADIKNRTKAELEAAENMLEERRMITMDTFQEAVGDIDLHMDILTSEEMLQALETFTDNSSVINI